MAQLVVAASDDGAEQVWDATSGKLRSQGNYLHSKILSVEFDRTSTLVVAAGAERRGRRRGCRAGNAGHRA